MKLIKIPSIKNQISIFNDQNIYHSCTTSLRKSRSSVDDAMGINVDRSSVWNFEFGSL